MKVLAVTGGIASGKSTVIAFLKSLDIMCFSSDELVAGIYKTAETLAFLEKNFPQAFRGKKFIKKDLKTIVFEDVKKLKILEEYFFPQLRNIRTKLLKKHINEELICFETPLLLELILKGEIIKSTSGKYDIYSHILLCNASVEVRLSRTIKRQGMNRKRFFYLNDLQSTFEQKKHLANYILNTDQPLDKMTTQITDILEKISIC